MGIYLPTITCLIDNKDVPNTSIETWHDVEYLLAKYYKETTYYSCTTRGYKHIGDFNRIIDAFFKNKIKTIYSEEVACLNSNEVESLLKIFLQVEEAIKKQPNLVKDILLNEEKNKYETLLDIYKEKPKQKEFYKQIIKTIEAFDLANSYKKASIQKEISEFDLQDVFKDNYLSVIAMAYWLKSQIFLLKKAIKHKKTILYVMLSPL